MNVNKFVGMYTMRMLESGGGGNVAAGGAPLHLPHQTQPPHPMTSHHIAMGSGLFAFFLWVISAVLELVQEQF